MEPPVCCFLLLLLGVDGVVGFLFVGLFSFYVRVCVLFCC